MRSRHSSTKKRVAAHIEEISQKYGLAVDPYAKVSTLTVGQQQRVEIIKALYKKKCDLLVLDEPTAVLTPQEKQGSCSSPSAI